MFKHIKDGYYIVHDEIGFKQSAKHFTKEYLRNPDGFDLAYNDKSDSYPCIFHCFLGYDAEWAYIGGDILTLADLKSALGDKDVS